MSSSISRIQASNIDGRARTPRFIQAQLQALHSSLLVNVAEIRQAIASSTNHTPAEVGVEYHLAVSTVKDQYESINLDQVLEEEYKIANGKDASDRRVAKGVVYIVPASHTLFYSTIAPLSAAIAAGNCVVMELGPTLSSINSLLRKLLPQALDSDTFTIFDSRPETPDFLNSCTQVLPTMSANAAANVLVSPSALRAVAVVDRSSNLKSAAAALVTARFSFGGRSSYAPDLVLVNEFVLDEFVDLVVREAAGIFSRGGSTIASAEMRRRDASENDFRDDGAVVVVSGDCGTILNVKSRNSKILGKKLSVPILAIHPITSLDDAIDFANNTNHPLLASYIFADPPAAKYLNQFIDAHLSLVNHIPVDLLVGPPTPLSYPTNLSPSARFTKEMFTAPRPAYICKPSALTTVLTTPSNVSIMRLEKETLKALTPTGQKPGHHLGFFEQGIVTGMALIFVPTVVGSLVLLGMGGRSLVRFLRQ